VGNSDTAPGIRKEEDGRHQQDTRPILYISFDDLEEGGGELVNDPPTAGAATSKNNQT
jgi:hypothetical protein